MAAQVDPIHSQSLHHFVGMAERSATQTLRRACQWVILRRRSMNLQSSSGTIKNPTFAYAQLICELAARTAGEGTLLVQSSERTFSMKKLLLISALTCATGAWAQTTSVPATGNVGGQASTQTQSGVPNPTQRPDGAMPKARADVKAGAKAQAQSPDTTKVPRGEASTMVNGQPNATPNVNERSRATVRSEAKQSPTQGKAGAAVGTSKVPTNPKNGTGTPQ